ncbi:hypothetical protein [Nonomuraea indica]|uniref:Uncharacterized protein n=1 Tax=Nonomuraea indica TaxID=1581193 RepID=A0ABW8AEU4_9ACTN
MYAAGGNPCGTSFATGPSGDGPDAAALEAARYQGRRLAEITIRLLRDDRVTDAAADDGNPRATMAGTPPRPRERRVGKEGSHDKHRHRVAGGSGFPVDALVVGCDLVFLMAAGLGLALAVVTLLLPRHRHG